MFALLMAVIIGAALLKPAENLFYKRAYPCEYSEYVSYYAKEYDVPQSLIYAVIRSESSFNPNAESSIGARGLMQITQDTYDWAVYRMGEVPENGYDSLWNPKENIRIGVYILSQLIREFKTEETAMCAYHAGWGNVKSWLADSKYSSDGINIHTIPFADTGQYVPKVMKTKEMYEELYNI
ncbi:MAG: lytic transglycosylase domain-containing protein [Oscillospiraceae bacterium]|nr:lytic transglycosylase domain-containing protein [Oscillospiraceae bacterium]